MRHFGDGDGMGGQGVQAIVGYPHNIFVSAYAGTRCEGDHLCMFYRIVLPEAPLFALKVPEFRLPV